MRRLLVALVIFTFAGVVPAVGQSGSIGGTVADPTGSPAGGVTVALTSADGSVSRAATTDARGRFSFTGLAAGTYTVEASAQGYETAGVGNIELADGESRQVQLRLVLVIGEQLVVTGSNIAGAAETGAIAVSVLDVEDLDTYGAVTPGEIYSNIAQAGEMEFNETADGPNSARGDIATINLRSLGAGNTLVLLNGRRLTPHPISQDISSTPQTVVNLNSIPSSAISRVEVLRDGASALYGTDATAGVVNTVLDTRFEGVRVNLRQANSEGTDFQESTLDLTGGWNFNSDRTNVTIFATTYTRDGMFARERDYMASVDKRPLLPENWSGDTQFRNTSTRSPWGEFQAGSLSPDGTFDGTRVRDGDGNSLTSSSGRFHIQPVSNPGGILLGTGVELDDGSLSTALRYDFGIPRQITPDVDRDSVLAVVTHDLDNGRQAFFELGYYQSDTFAQRAPQPIDNGLAFIIVPKQNYWNPFGPVGSANRIPGIDAPAEGLDVLIRRYRPLEHGPRLISTDSDNFRILAGLRGTWKEWGWESAAFYNEANTTDEEGNRFSKTGFFNQLALSTPDALNPFAGTGLGDAPTPCCPQPTTVGPNPASVLDPIRISSVNKAESSLTSWDFRASNPDKWSMKGGPVGVAFGGEWRREEYVDDRDPRLDGTIFYRQGVGSDLSDVIGVSPTADSSGSRNVYSVYGEALVPLVGPKQNAAAAVRLDLQAAVRVESFSDTGEDVVKPKVALSWFPTEWLLFRSAYSEGFRAPNLVQLNRGDISRLNQGQEDFWRSDVTDLPDDTGETYRRSVRISNPDLESEETETQVFGFQISPGAGKFSFSADYFKFEQENVIDNFGVEEQLALDFLLRKQGSSNPNVVREAVTPEDEAFFAAWNAANPDDQRAPAGVVRFVEDPYLNLDPRTVEGIDLAVGYRAATNAGTFNLQIEASHLMTFDQRRDSLQPLLDDPVLGGEFAAQAVDRIKLNGKPEWRHSGSLNWRKGSWRAGASYKYISEFFDTSATNDTTGEFWTVEDWSVYNLFAEYGFGFGITVRAGVNNIADEDPPLADETRGYFSSYHNNRGRQYWMRVTYSR